MKRINHTIRRKKIPEVKLVSLTGKTWYDSNGTPTSWTGATDFLATGFTPDTGFLVFNVTGGTVDDGYYIYNGTKWIIIDNSPICDLNDINLETQSDKSGTTITSTVLYNDGKKYKNGYYEWNTPETLVWNFLGVKYDDFQLPLFLEATADEMGDMVEFDKNIGHNKISANFAYESVCTETGSTITINNTTTYQLVNIILANDTNPDGSINETGVRRLTSEIPEQNILNQEENFIVVDGQDLSISGSSFTVHWGDETTSPIGINGSVTKSFDVAEEKTIRIVFESPYLTNQVVKVVNCGESAVSYMRINTEDLIPIQSENNNYINVG
jgi:hypothetical protein